MAGFILDGRIAMVLLTSIPSDELAPTQAELGAGVSLIGTKQAEELIAIEGWTQDVAAIPTPGYAGVATGSLAGESSYPQSSLTWRKDDTSETIYSAVAATNTLQWIYVCQDGLGSGEEALGFPVTIATRERSPERNVPNSFTCAFSVTPPYEATQAA